MSIDPVDSGFNTGASTRDIGLATDYTLSGPVARASNTAGVSAFYNAIRTQGDESVRQKAITRMMERACSSDNLPDKAFRILHRLAQNCRGVHRYSFEPHDTLAFYCGLASAQNFSRYLRVLLELKFVVRFVLPRPSGGHPIPIYTVVCTSEDRTGVGRRRLREMALARRRIGLQSPKVAVSPLGIEQGGSLHTLEIENTLTTPDNEGLQFLALRIAEANSPNVTSEDCTKSSGRGNASPQEDDHNANKASVESESTTVAQVERGYGGEAKSRRKRMRVRPKATAQQFDRFWRAYPCKKNKMAALFRFLILSRKQAEHAVCAAEILAEEVKSRRSGGNVWWPEYWLRTRQFEAYPIEEVSTSAG